MQNKKESGFIYLMSFPFISDLPKFIEEYKLDINFQDESGNIPLMTLINKKQYIIQVSKEYYDKALKYLLDNQNINIIKNNNNNLRSLFHLCLMKEYYEEAKVIIQNFKKFEISYFNSIILNYIIEKNDPQKIIHFLNEFKDIIDFNSFNVEQKKSLNHYICLYFSDNNHIKIFTKLISFIAKLKIDNSTKDQYDRNCLFYLFIDQNDNSKVIDPINHLMYIFKKFQFNNLNDKDIFGNNLLFYVIQSKATKCFYFLLNNGFILSNEQPNNENSVFSLTLLNNFIQTFYYLYEKIKDPNIFNHKIYEPYKIKNFDYENLDLDEYKNGETLYDFLNKNKFEKNDTKMNNNNFQKRRNNNLLYNNKYNNINNFNNYNNINNFNNNNNINNTNNFNNYNSLNNFNNNNNISNITNNFNKYNNNEMNFFNINKDFGYLSFLNENVLVTLHDYTNKTLIQINNNINDTNLNNINEKDNYILSDFFKKNEEYISNRKNCKRKIISENLFRYCLSNHNKFLCKFMIDQKYNIMTICNEYIYFKKQKKVKDCLSRIILENNKDQSKLINLRDNEGQTIYHLLPFVEDNLSFCKMLENHNISNIYDLDGNTPLFNACQNFDRNFIQIFTHYSFNSEKQGDNMNYNLFLETKNNKTPLEALYEQINKKENKILQLIINISINTKQVYFIHVIKYLIQNYSPDNNNLFKFDYKANLNSNDYLKNVIGLYQFYTKELNGNISVKDELGNDPLILCAQEDNFNFLFNVLYEEYNINLNSTNNEGKSVIHLILQLPEKSKENKKNILIKAIELGFDFNIKDKDGLLPIDYAHLEVDNEIYNILKQYYTFFGIEIEEHKNIELKRKLDFDYNKDSDNFYNESISVSMNIDKYENINGLISSSFKYDPVISYYILCADEENIPFNANLVKKDFNNLNGFNDKKFCLQIIKDLNNDNEFLTLAVDNLDLKKFTFKNFISAQQKFKDLFKELTGCDWDNVKYNKLNLITDYSKYYIFDSSFDEENAIYDYLKITIKNLYIKKKSEYKGNVKIKNLIYYLLVKSYQNKFSIDENTLNVEQNTKNILQAYKSTAITKAISILFELKKLLNCQNKDDIYHRKKNYLINSYNDLIPYSKKVKDLNQFNDPLNIDHEISRLTNYYYIENVLKIFLGAIYNLNNIHPLDYIINALGCTIEEIPKPQNKNQLITEEDYIYNFVNSTNSLRNPITAIYKIIQSVNDKHFNLNNYDNRYIFCHGTKVENVIGILSQGLKIAPVQAINTGKSLGNGIYLSDNFSYSSGYCVNVPQYRNNYYILILQVIVLMYINIEIIIIIVKDFYSW